MIRSNTNYHGSHEYSTFSASTIGSLQHTVTYKNALHKYICCLCDLSSSLIFHPVGPFRCIWDLSVMLVLIYTSIEIPFTMSFGQSTPASYIGLLVDFFLLMDIFLNFHTAYFDKYDHLRLVTNKKYICLKYFRSWFLIDLITCIPFQFIFNPNHVDTDDKSALNYIKILRIFRLLRIVKILRFLKMLRIFDTFMRQFMVREMIIIMKMIKIVFGMILFAHFAACLWWYVGIHTSPSWVDVHGLRNDNLGVFAKYSYAWYWAVVTLFTTGYGDITATNTTEQWVCSISILVGTCFFAYFVGTLTVYITEGDKVQSFRSDKLEEAQSFCEKKKLPKELTRAVLTHIRYHCTYNYVFDEGELLSLLPAYLQHDIHGYVAKQFLLQLKLFRNECIHLSDFVIGLIAVKCKSISCNQSYKLYDIEDTAKEFYIQRTGKSFMYNKNDELIQELSRGSVCGEYSSFLFKKRKTKLECETWSEFYAINIDDIRHILDVYYPKSSQSKWKSIKTYLRTAYDANVKHSVEINHYNGINENAHQPNTFKQKSISIFYQPTFVDKHEQSVHLFNTTKAKEAHSDSIRNHILIPPGTPMSDHEDEEMIYFTPDRGTVTKQIIIKRPTSYEYSEAVDHAYKHTGTLTNDEEAKGEKEKHIKRAGSSQSTEDKDMKSERRNSKKFDFKANKFLLRSNSAVRDSIIVAHAEKHRDSDVTQDSLPQGRSSTIKVLCSDSANNAYKHNSMKQPPVLLQNSLSEDDDSECSFFSTSSEGTGSDEERKGLKVQKYSNAVKKKTTVVRKAKTGKFRASKVRNIAVSKLKQHNSQSPPAAKKRRGMKRKKSNETSPDTMTGNTNNTIRTQPSLVSLVSLEDRSYLVPLKSQTNINTSLSVTDTCIAHDIPDSYLAGRIMTKPMNINISNITVDDYLHNGKVTPLNTMPIIRSHSARDVQIPNGQQLENSFDAIDVD